MAGFVCLLPTILRELHTMIGNGLVDFAVFCRRIESEHWFITRAAVPQKYKVAANEGMCNVLFPSDCACLIRMMSLGFPIVANE